jgi:3-methyladenine DNA glycosylase AlkD
MAQPSPDWTAEDVLAHLKMLGSEEDRAGMARFGIATDRAFGVGHTVLRPLARWIGRDHGRALQLWESGWREARLLAAFSEEPAKVTIGQCRRWAADFDSWEIVDGVADLFVDMPFWRELIEEFAEDEREFVRRTAFAMLAWAAVHRKKEPDATFRGYLPLVEAHSGDPRNFVKKAVNWALRQIGKRSLELHAPALELARRLTASRHRTARWVGMDAARELSAAKTIERVTAKAAKDGYAAEEAASFSSTR